MPTREFPSRVERGFALKTLLLFATTAAPAFAVSVSVGLYGGAALPVGGLASPDPGYFNWLIEDDPGSEHDLVDIRGLTLSGADAAPCPVAGVKSLVDVKRWLDVEAGAFYQFNRSRRSDAKSAVENAETKIAGVLVGANFKRGLGPFRAHVGGGAGRYFTEVSLYASGEGRSGFVYSNVYTLERSVDTSSWGWYAGGGVAYPLSAKISLELNTRLHAVVNDGAYDVLIHEEYGYEPYHKSEYVFETPVYKTYRDYFWELSAGITYRLR